MFRFSTRGMSGVLTMDDSTIVSATRHDGSTMVALQVSYSDGTEEGSTFAEGFLSREQAVELILALSEAIREL